MSKRNYLGALTLAGMVAMFAVACGDAPTTVEEGLPQPGIPVFAGASPFNDLGACMGNDVLAYNALVPPNQKSSWSRTAVPNGNFCTANDIYLATAVVYAVETAPDVFEPVTGPITCVEGETFRVKVAAQLGQNAASARTDIGVWIGQPEEEGDPMPTQAVDGTCNHYNLVLGETGVLDLDGDQCGDMASEAGELLDLDLEELTLSCTPNENNQVEVPSCIGWTVPGGDRECPFDGSDPINFRMGTVPVNTSKCNCEPFELDIVVLKVAHLEVRKEVDPTDDDGNFDLLIDDVAEATDVGHNGTTGKQDVGAGTSLDPGADHTFAEEAGTDTDLADYVTTWECRDRGEAAGSRGSGTGAGPETITLQPDDDVVCTFTNVRNPEVRLVKEFDPTDDGGAVSFTVDGDVDDNSGAGYGHGGTTDWYQFAVGDDVAFSEAGFGGTDLGNYSSSWECDNGEDGTGTSGSTGALAAGDRVTCTFTNVRRPEVRVVKEFDPATDPGTVDFVIDGDAFDNGGAGYGHGEGTDFILFDVGDVVDFSETSNSIDLVNYTSTWECDDGESGNGTSGSTAALSAGDQVTCTFTNTLIPVEVETETAFAFGGGLATCFIPQFSSWGWTNGTIVEGFSGTWPMYAGAADCDISKGTHAANVTIEYDLAGNFSWNIVPLAGFTILSEHVYADSGPYPLKNGQPTVAPGQYYIGADLSGPIHVIVHAVIGAEP